MIKYFHVIASCIFLAMAWVQLNDPDPLYWLTTYLATAWLAGLNVFGKKAPVLTYVIMGLVLAGVLISGPGSIRYFTSGDFASIYGKMRAETPYVEYARELGGLLIAAIYLAFTRR